MSHYQETLFAVRCESIAHEVGAPTVWTGQGESDHTERTLAYHPDVSRYQKEFAVAVENVLFTLSYRFKIKLPKLKPSTVEEGLLSFAFYKLKMKIKGH